MNTNSFTSNGQSRRTYNFGNDSYYRKDGDSIDTGRRKPSAEYEPVTRTVVDRGGAKRPARDENVRPSRGQPDSKYLGRTFADEENT